MKIRSANHAFNLDVRKQRSAFAFARRLTQALELMTKSNLPPRIAEIIDGAVTWQRLEGVDYEVLGYFLSCHLIIEHYLDEYLKICYSSLDWDAARQTFGQKVALLSNFKVSDKYDCIPAIKHLNALRNKFSHDIEFKIERKDLLPLKQYLDKVYEGGKTKPPTEPKEILDQFTTMTCVLFAGSISTMAKHTKVTRKRVLTLRSSGTAQKRAAP
jgi:hypothetical protein